MSIDKLQKRIRKLKNPVIVDLTITQEDVVPEILAEAGAFLPAYEKICTDLIGALHETVPAVRFDFDFFAVMGAEGLAAMERLMKLAGNKGYYVLLDGLSSGNSAVIQAAMAMPCDGLTVSPYLGSDHIKAFADFLTENEKSLFVMLRSPNRSASEIQDLMTGSRLVHHAAADILNRLGEKLVGKCGYTQVAGIGAANAPDSLRHLRSKYSRLFLMVDGYDYNNANAKNCSFAFDQFGHGAVVCSGTGITAAWKEQKNVSYVDAAVEAAKKMQKNILRYTTIL